MSGKQVAFATMITNFDSTEQRREWKQIVRDHNVPFSWYRLWHKDGLDCTCNRLLNDETAFASHFAGVIRTAYLYCPRIMLTDAQLFDGVFFLALGPHAVNDILGKSYKDGPAIIVSGRRSTLEDCLVNLTVRSIGEIKKNSDTLISCSGDDSQYAVRPLEYSALGGANVCSRRSLSMDAGFYETLTRRLEQASRQGATETKAQIIAEALSYTLYGINEMKWNCAFLAQRWQEWIDAEHEGLVLYENQNDENVKQRSKGTFGELFHKRSEEYGKILRGHMHSDVSLINKNRIHEEDDEDRKIFDYTLDALMNMPKRSDAFRCIRKTNLPEFHQGKQSSAYTKHILHDWYQLVYQQSIAELLGVYLVAVDAPENSFAQLAGKRSNGAALMLSGNITNILGGMPFIRFASFCYECRGTIQTWRECGPRDGMHRKRIVTRNIAYSVEQAGQERSLKGDRRNMLWGALITMVLAFISAMNDNVWLNGNAPIWLIVVAAWVISIVPDLINMISWAWEVRSSSKTVVYLG